MKTSLKIDILGTKYTLRRVDSGKDEFMEENRFCGYCADCSKEIVLLNLSSVPSWKKETEEVIRRKENETLRHEIIHAYLNESGLQWNTFAEQKAWAKNEEMIDWIAIQFPKILKTCKEVGCIEY